MNNDFERDVVGWVMGWTVAQLIRIGTSAVTSMQGDAVEVPTTALESSMHNVIPFQARPAQVEQRTIDVSHLQWVPLSELRELLWRWDAAQNGTPNALRQVLKIIADDLLLDCTDADAKKQGWRDAAAMHERGRDMLQILEEHRPEERP